MFPDREKEDFIKECQGTKYWCPNGNLLKPISTRPKPGELDEPAPQMYGNFRTPYGNTVDGAAGFHSTLHKLPVLEPSAEPRGPPT